MHTGKKISKIRKLLDITQETLASGAGISVGTLSKIERGVHGPSLRTANKIADALGVPLRLINEGK